MSAQTLRLPDGPGSVRGLGDDVSVDGFSAQVLYSVPLELPQGIGGFAPALALTYSGELGNGSVGVGWTLPVMSIRRSLRPGVPSYMAADELELVGISGGGRLVPLADGTWRLEGSGQQVKVEQSGSGFLVTENGGVRYRLGTTADARMEVAGTGAIAAWFAEEVLHPAGHRIALTYLNDGGQVYPMTMRWGPADAFQVQFLYETRPDTVTSYRTGFLVSTAKRLKEVRVHAFAENLRSYLLSYDNAFALSRLSQVQMTGRGGVGAFPALGFTYAQPLAERVVKQTGVDGWILNTRGVSLMDVDGDGMSDLVRTESGSHAYKKGLGGSFGASVTMTGPAASLSAVRVMDVDGDARPELVRYLSSAWRPYRLNGNAWVDIGSAWPGSNTLPVLDSNYFYADLNGDGRTDVIRSVTNGIWVKLNSASGFGAWLTRPFIGGGTSTLVPGPNERFHDVNGDGLADVVQLTDALIRVYLGKGDGTFVLAGSFNHPWGTGAFPLADIRLCDLNRDGLMDVVRLSASHVYWYVGKAGGGVQPTPRYVPRPGSASYDSVVAISDVNGNGSEDVVWSSQEGLWVLDLAGPTSAGMLVGVDNGLGKTLSLSYSASAVLSVAADAAGQPWTSKLPVSVPVPVSLTVQPGMDEPARSTEYLVRDGFWDAVEHRFGGFLTSIRRSLGATAAETLVETTRHHAGLGNDRVLRGVPLEVRTENGVGTLFTRVASVHEARAVEGLPDVPLLRRNATLAVRTWNHEGVSTPIETLTAYTYDTRVRPVEEVHSGRLDLLGDEKRVQRAYASDAMLWVQDAVCEEKVRELDGTLLSHARTFYGDATQVFSWTDVADCRVGRLVREAQGWLEDAHSPRWVLQEAREYDAWDNPTHIFTKGVWRTLGYDANHLRPVLESLSPSTGYTLSWTSEWDDVLGKATSVTAPEGVKTELGYDSLGRLTSMAVAGAPPHVRYAYDWTPPRPRTFTYVFDGDLEALPGSWMGGWVAGGAWRETVAIANGAGEALYSATRLSPLRWTVSGWQERDARGQVSFVGDAFYADGSLPGTRPVGLLGQMMAHDALGRLVSQQMPNGGLRTLAYKAFEATQSDSELAPVITRMDGLSRILRTQRQVGTVLESVDAVHDAAGRLRTLGLQGGAVTHSFTYDTLGRMVAATDPDVGVRALRYDDHDRPTHHTNGANQTRQYFYDEAGRLTRTQAEDGTAFVYHYDVNQDGSALGGVAGRLAWVEEPYGAAHLRYDAFGRTVFQQRVIDGETSMEEATYSPSGLLLESKVDGMVIPRSYDAAGRAMGIGTYWQALQMDAAGRVLEEQYGNGVRQLYERDVLGFASRMQTVNALGISLYDVTLTRNAYAAPLTVTDTDGRGLNHSAVFSYDTAARLTDAILGAVPDPGGTLGQGAGSYLFGYEYDGLQNMVGRNASGPAALGILTGTFHFGERGFGPRQLTRVVAASGDTLMDYDAAGRQVRQGGRLMTYNGLDQLATVTLPGTGGGASQVVEHAYGYTGLRVRTESPTGETQYWFSPQVTQRPNGIRERYLSSGERTVVRIAYEATAGGQLAGLPGVGWPREAELDQVVGRGLGGLLLGTLVLMASVALSRSSSRSRWQRLTAGVLAVAVLGLGCESGVRASSLAIRRQAVWTATGTLYFQGGVSPGPVLITRADGSVQEERRYESFGAPVDAYREFVGGGSAVGTVDHGEEPLNALNNLTDPHTGWSDHGARWMAPELALWLTPDPPMKSPDPKFLAQPWDLHPYQYVRQNPTIYWDPDGREPVRNQAGTAAGFRAEFETNKGREVGEAAEARLVNLSMIRVTSMGNVSPRNTGFTQDFVNRYVYTEHGGWIDMNHFVFYAGLAYEHKEERKSAPNAVPRAIQRTIDLGKLQEETDNYRRNGIPSRYSYEDLPSDLYGAQFGAAYFDPTSEKSLAEQMEMFLGNLGATSSERAPNYQFIPADEVEADALSKVNKGPTGTNMTAEPQWTMPVESWTGQ
ncbi:MULTISPECIES: FG-GAP-like repeat-containing protein [Corallococcus]|uniref:FG-GAP-like repeat-containing protein n=1 Tax=Corallococcus TaxID=83461 RepID=UPI00131531D7|nr:MULTISPECIES: FG-GAP-like repeat-containing protein [Corallococcus]